MPKHFPSMYVRAWQPTYTNPDDTLWFIGHTNEALLSDEELAKQVDLALKNGLELGSGEVASDFHDWLETQGYIAFYTAGPGTVFKAELGD